MPRYDGIWTLRRLRELGVGTPVLVLTTFNDDTLVLEALRAGARHSLRSITVRRRRAAEMHEGILP